MTTQNNDRGQWTSASNSSADFLCAGRHLAQKGILEPPKSADADFGSGVHRALATGDISKLSLAQAESYEACVKIGRKLGADYFRGKTPTVFMEQRLWLGWGEEPNRLWHSGQYDLLLRHESQGMILDFKALAGDVAENPRNMQLRDLACLVYGNMKTIGEIAVAIVQPLVTHSPVPTLYAEEDLQRATNELAARVVKSNDPNSPRTPGNVQCQFCLAKTRCTEYAAWAGSVVPASTSVQEAFSTSMDLWTPDQRARMAEILTPAAKFLDEIKAFLKAGLEQNPDFVPGWYLKPGNKREEITDAQECFNRFCTLGGTPEQFMAVVKIGKTRLKEKLADVTSKKGKSLETALSSLLDGIVDVSQNEPSLRRKE